MRELLRAGVPVNNQSVLMRGINDTVETQLALSHALLRVRVRPYYLFHADEVRDTEHLRAPAETGIKVIEGMRGHTSGLGVPTFVVDVPGGGGNIPLQPNYILSYSEDEVILRNYEWQIFRYRNARPEDTGTRAPASATNGKVVPLLNHGATVGNSKGWAANTQACYHDASTDPLDEADIGSPI